VTDELIDTSVAVPLVLARHEHHDDVTSAIGDREVRLGAHAQLECYSVLTRLPGDARLAPDDADDLLADRFGEPVPWAPIDDDASLLRTLASAGIVGGAVYDGLIGLTARRVGATLITRDRRAVPTLTALDVAYELLTV
jgi:predicted nucleic acid-binding protein